MKKFGRTLFGLAVFVSLISETNAQSISVSVGPTFSKTNIYYKGVREFLNQSYEANYVNQMGETFEEKQETCNKVLVGINAQVNYLQPLSERLDLETGLLYTTKGFSYSSLYTDKAGDGSYDYKSSSITTQKFHYLDIPLSLKFSFYENDAINIYGSGGLFFGFALSAKETREDEFRYYYNDGINVYDQSESSSITETIELDEPLGINWKTNIGLLGGFGVDFKGIFFEGRYHIGIANLGMEDDEMYMRNDILLSVGYRYSLKK